MTNAPFPYRTPRLLASALVVLSWGLLVIVSTLAVGAGFTSGLPGLLALAPVAGISLFGVLFGELCCAVFDIARSLPTRSAREQ